MKLKRWLMPIVFLLIYTGMFVLSYLISTVSNSDNVIIIAIPTMMLSTFLMVGPFITSIIYRNKFLNNSPHKIWFTFYNASLYAIFYFVLQIIFPNELSILLAIYQFIACFLAALPPVKHFDIKETHEEHTAPTANISTDNNQT